MAGPSAPSFSLLSQDVDMLHSPPVLGSDNDDTVDILAEMEQGNGSSGEEDECNKEEWLPLDEDLLSAALNGGVERSRSVNSWARRRFDEWRKAFNYDLSIPIEKLPLRELNDMLAKFIIQVKKKKDHKLYPPSSLSSLYRAIGRIVRREQEKRIGETGVREPAFDILTDAIFCQSKEAFVGMIRKTRQSGNYDRPKQKAPAISFAVENEILADIDHQITHPMGCIKRLVYFMLMRFGIRAVKELHAVKDCDLVLESDDIGEFIKYGERISKNRNPTAKKFDDHHFRQPIWTYEKDFLLTYKQYVRHLPAKEKDSEPRPLFLQPIPKPRSMIWYSVTPVGVNNLGKWLKTMASVVSPETMICNKSGRVTLVSRLAAKDVPSDVGMKVTGHKSTQGYERYDRTKESKINACMDIICQPSSQSFAKALSDQIAKRESLGEISSNITSSSSTVLRVSDLPNVCGKENVNTAVGCPILQVSIPDFGPTVDEPAVPLVVTNVTMPNAPLVVPNILQSSVSVEVPVEVPDPLVPPSSAPFVQPSIQLVGSNAPNGDAGQLVTQKLEVSVEKAEDDFDDAFYCELSKKYPDSAKALGKFIGPAISNQGTFNNCTFNFGLDPALIFEAMNAAFNKGSRSSSVD